LCRIVRDYEKYISRQLKRGTSRQELNVSWLKKNELDLKRHVIELRESVKNNWTTTGTEVTRDLWQLWEKSRPASPARLSRTPSEQDLTRGLRSPTALSALSRLEFPGRASNDFATGYSLGLVGGIRSWVGILFFFLDKSRLITSDDSKSYIFTSSGQQPR
jgi:choline-phosphate cytidylyltransferase